MLDAASVGILASEALACPSDAIVVARFERSFCLDVGTTLITIGDRGLHDGPLNVRLKSEAGSGLTSDLAIETDQRWTVSSYRLRRHDGLEIELGHAQIWQPDRPHGATDPSQLRDGLNNLLARLEERDHENGGLIRLVLPNLPPRTATERAAKPHIEALMNDLPCWLLDDAPPDQSPAIQLLGLGPGLTPSGDDLLAGILIAWHQIGARRASRCFSKCLLEACATRTTPISLAHLTAAAKGYGAAPLHCLLNAVIANRQAELEEALDAAAKIGHSSGLDAIVGMVLALNAWQQADDKTPVIA